MMQNDRENRVELTLRQQLIDRSVEDVARITLAFGSPYPGQQSRDEVERTLHRLSGAASIFGLVDVADAAESLRALLDGSAEPDRIPQALHALCHCVSMLSRTEAEPYPILP
jgi:HPt (histidine-containing phosphotransfer) domain-containing protein